MSELLPLSERIDLTTKRIASLKAKPYSFSRKHLHDLKTLSRRLQALALKQDARAK